MTLDELVRICVAAGLILIVLLAILVVSFWIGALGYSTYEDKKARLCSEKLNQCGLAKENLAASASRFLKFATEKALVELSGGKVDRRLHDLQDQIQAIHKKAGAVADPDSLQRYKRILGSLSGRAISSNPEEFISSKVADLKDSLNAIENNAEESTARRVVALADSYGFCQWVGELSKTESGWTPFKPVRAILGTLLDYVGRGTTVGILIGLSIALAQGAKFESYATTLPIIGGIIGGFTYGLVLLPAVFPGHPRISRWVYSLLILILPGAYVAVSKFLL
ncbi:hypothetical protein V3M63_06575 [Trueperella pyogenes]|uniref:hypothetical protein n=1 Tax=Trueperella pyogenes TaxID=1661 RepID=UPI00345CD824